jgi:hypothetical protein
MSSQDQLLEKWARVAKRVAYKTLDNELRWEDTERDGVYQTSFPEYTIRIEKQQLREDTAQPTEIVITLHNDWGKAIGEITESEYAQTGHSTALLHEMYRAAEQRAMKLEESLDDVLKYLEK